MYTDADLKENFSYMSNKIVDCMGSGHLTIFEKSMIATTSLICACLTEIAIRLGAPAAENKEA